MSDQLKTVYLAHNGDDENSGLTEQAPKRTLAAAVETLNEKPGDIRALDGVVHAGEKPVRLRSGQWILGTD